MNAEETLFWRLIELSERSSRKLKHRLHAINPSKQLARKLREIFDKYDMQILHALSSFDVNEDDDYRSKKWGSNNESEYDVAAHILSLGYDKVMQFLETPDLIFEDNSEFLGYNEGFFAHQLKEFE